MNDLNAQQIVLLTLLVSFVTSIATGITTVSLLEQAPEPVTQTINRVVEKTVERIIPPEEQDGTSVIKTPEKEVVTVVVKDEDLTIDAVNRNSKSLARIYQKNGISEVFIGLGIIFDKNGRIVTDSSAIQSAGRYSAIYPGGSKYNLSVGHRQPNDPYAILRIADGQNASTDFSPASFADSQNLKLAQSVISLSGVNSNTVSTGIITNLITSSGNLNTSQVNADSKPVEQLKLIETSVDKSNVLLGSIILNLQGEIIGARINGDLAKVNTFTPSNNIKNFLNGK